VSGLTSAVCLAEAGLAVRIWTAEPHLATTSAVAGAVWAPYRAGADRLRVAEWSRTTLAELSALARPGAGAGVRMAAIHLVSQQPEDLPWWAEAAPDLRQCRADELPAGYPVGFRCALPVIDMPAYLGYLAARLAAAGGTVEERPVQQLADAAAAARLVVNCAGLGARQLAGDPSVRPVRGQVVVVANPGLDDVFVEAAESAAEITYVIPHHDRVVLGGTAEDSDWRLEPDPRTAARIVERCAAIDPRLAGVPVLGHRVGLRPVRPLVRLEAERLSGARIVHNYGHGGAGVTLSWGCAREVAAIALAS
jgi:D-amino-acid oxidase